MLLSLNGCLLEDVVQRGLLAGVVDEMGDSLERLGFDAERGGPWGLQVRPGHTNDVREDQVLVGEIADGHALAREGNADGQHWIHTGRVLVGTPSLVYEETPYRAEQVNVSALLTR